MAWREIRACKRLRSPTPADETPVPGTAATTVDNVETVAAIPGYEGRPLDIGVTYDSADDSARVTLVNSYAGTKVVTAFIDGTGTPMGAKPLMVDDIDHDNDPDTMARSLPLTKASGTFLQASGLTDSGTIATGTTSTAIYYYETSTGKTYVRSSGVDVTANVTRYDYQVVNIRPGAKIPGATLYSHLHFGVWAGLSGSGENEIADLGIGFVANIGEMTSNMPNFGTANFEGNWVANVQEMDPDGDGDFTLEDGVATMTADFGKGDVDVMLMGLASLDGTIDGNTFSGTKKATLLGTDATDEPVDLLDATGTFAGNFSGAFFGPLAAEAGGVFDFASDDDNDGKNEGGAFRGAFGADQKAN